MSTEVRSLNSYIQQQEVLRQKLLDEIEQCDKKITERIQDREKKFGEMQQNILILTGISLQFFKSKVPVTDEVKLRREQKIKQFDEAIKVQQNIIDRYDTLDIPTLKENKSKAGAQLALVEADIEQLKAIKAIKEFISKPIDTSGLDLSTLEDQTPFNFKR